MSQSFPAGGDRKAKHMARTAAQSPPPKKAKEDRERTVALLKKKTQQKNNKPLSKSHIHNTRCFCIPCMNTTAVGHAAKLIFEAHYTHL